MDRSSAPHRVSPRAPPSSASQAIAALRRLRFTGPEIAEVLGMALSTVSGILTRIGMGKLGRLGLEPAVRYERAAPRRADPHRRQEARAHRAAAPATASPAAPHNRATTTHGGIAAASSAGSSCTSPSTTATRLAYAEVLADEKATTAIGFLRRAIAFFAATASPSSADHRQRLGLPLHRPRHRLPRPGHPPPAHPPLPAPDQRQGRTLHPHHARRLGLRRDLPQQHERTAALDGWLYHYNHHRRHSALGRQAPDRPPQRANNLLGTYS